MATKKQQQLEKLRIDSAKIYVSNANDESAYTAQATVSWRDGKLGKVDNGLVYRREGGGTHLANFSEYESGSQVSFEGQLSSEERKEIFAATESLIERVHDAEIDFSELSFVEIENNDNETETVEE